jgi:hypothetical protein
MWTDELSTEYADLLDGSYNCVDRIVLNAYCTLCYSAGRFRTWWRRLHEGCDDELDNNHLTRMAGRFSRRVHGYAEARGIPVIQCNTEQRKHLIAEEYLQKNPAGKGFFLILVSRAVATMWRCSVHKGGKLLHCPGQPRRSGQSRRYLVRSTNYRATEPDLRPPDLYCVPVFCAGSAGAAA